MKIKNSTKTAKKVLILKKSTISISHNGIFDDEMQTLPTLTIITSY